MSMRIGEALHPGPDHIHIGCLNPTGLRHKASLVSDLPAPGIWGVSETHLSHRGVHQFRTEMSCQSQTMSITPGAPAPLRSSSLHATGGKACGVAALSTEPTRALPNSFPKELFESSRMQTVITHWQNDWISGGVVYGFSAGSQTLAVQGQTNTLVSQVVQRIADQSVGKRFICGDWNQPHNLLECTKVLRAQGWMEAQDFAEMRWQITPKATCSTGNRIDFLWLSPELLPYVEQVCVEEVGFPDHYGLWVKCRSWQKEPPTPFWRMPVPIPWHEVNAKLEHAEKKLGEYFSAPKLGLTMSPHESDEQYRILAMSLEDSIQQALIRLGEAPMRPAQLGRAKTKSVSLRKKRNAPLKASRPGDHTPGVHVDSHVYACMFRQLRRLQHLARLVRQANMMVSQLDHATQLWQSIVKAKGFSPNFSCWSLVNLSHEFEEPLASASQLPHELMIQRLHDSMHDYVRKFERDLIKSRMQLAKENRLHNPHAIFKDLKPPRALPVQILLAKQICQVEELVTDEHAVCIDRPFTCDPLCPVIAHDSTHIVVHTDEKQIWFDDGPLPPVGTVLWQHKFHGSLSEMFDAFGTEWSRRWCRHDKVPTERWQAIIDFAQHVLPTGDMQFPSLDGESLQQCAMRKKDKSATGPDGISVRDLKQAPLAWHDSMAALLNQVESGQPWPSQMLQGHITAIEKTEQAAEVGQFRPICVLSAAYRTWATVRAKELLQQLGPRTPDRLYGSAPKRSAADMVTALQMNIENSYALNTPIAGAVLDLEKCFNTLPRIPLIAVGRVLGLPHHVARTWLAALMGLERRFKIRQAVGPGLPSSTGFAEGDPLSVIAMYFANVLADWYLFFESPSVHLWTYVDNIEITGPSARHVQHGMQKVSQFCQQLDVTIDPKKSYCWSTFAVDRHALRKDGARVCSAQRDLGGHLSYSRRHTNFTIVQKIDSMKELWSRLARSQAPTAQKQKAILVAAWPRCLHGVGTVSIGNQKLQDLRIGAMKGLQANKKGASAIVHLSLCDDPRLDPGFFALLASLKSFRKYGDLDTSPIIFEDHAYGQTTAPGPVATLASRLQQIGWNWSQGVTFVDQIGLSLHLVQTPWKALLSRLRCAWQESVAEKAQTRPTFQGLAQADPQFTMHQLRTLPQAPLTLMKRALNGTFYTNDKLVHAGKVPDSQCSYCGQTDNAAHRYWSCPHFEPLRSVPTLEVREFLQTAEPVTLHHGWIGKNWWEDDWLRKLHALPDRTTDFIGCFQVQPQVWDIFTDGSGFDPTNPLTRITSWGVVVGTCKDASSFSAVAPAKQVKDGASNVVFSFFPLAAGITPGIHQTVLRAELTGAIAALKWGIHTGVPVRLWCDNQRVCDHINQCQTGAPKITALDDDHDLLGQIQTLMSHPIHSQSSVIKVAAHQADASELASADLFAFTGNDQAHHVANNVRYEDNPEFWSLWEKLKSMEQLRIQVRHHVHETIIRISNEAVSCKVDRTGEVPQGSALGTLLNPSFVGNPCQEAWSDPKITPTVSDQLKEWISLLGDENYPLRWVSLVELFVTFQTSTDSLGVRLDRRRRQWTLIPKTAWDREELTISILNRQFAKFLRNLCRILDVTYTSTLGRSSSDWYTAWSNVLRVRWPPQLASVAEEFPRTTGRPIQKIQDVIFRH